jgi:hypothetical protein
LVVSFWKRGSMSQSQNFFPQKRNKCLNKCSTFRLKSLLNCFHQSVHGISEMVSVAVYKTIHSSNHAAKSTPSRAKHSIFSTTTRFSRKHPPCQTPTPRYQTYLLLCTLYCVLCISLWNPRIFPIPPHNPLWKSREGFGAWPPDTVNSVITTLFFIFTTALLSPLSPQSPNPPFAAQIPVLVFDW